MLIIIINFSLLTFMFSKLFRNLFKHISHHLHTFTFTFIFSQTYWFQCSYFLKNPFNIFHKNLRVNMASSSIPSSGSQKIVSSEQYEVPFRTLLTPVKNLEVLSELIMDFNSLKENGFDLSEEIKAQGWEKYFDRLVGPTFPILVKKFWIHASSSNHQVTSYIMGKKIVLLKTWLQDW